MTREELFQLHQSMSAKGLEIMKVKNNDYAGSKVGDSPFENFRRSEVLGIPGELGLLVRVMDKICRIKTFVENGTLAVKGEPVDDAVLDILNYMVLLQGMIEERRAVRDFDPVMMAERNSQDRINCLGAVAFAGLTKS